MDINPVLFKKITARIQAAESQTYQDRNAKTDALGRYQFHPKYWWEPIKKFAKKAGYNKGEEITKEDFLNNVTLQDEFFKHYVETKMMPFVEEQMKYNKRNVSPDEMAQMYHLNPEATKVYIRGGKWDIGDAQEYNAELKEYLDNGKAGLEYYGLAPSTQAEMMTPEEISSKKSEYFNQFESLNKEFDSGSITKGAYDQRKKALDQQYVQLGLSTEINNEIALQNAEIEKGYDAERVSIDKMYGILSGDIDDDDIRVAWDDKNKRVSMVAENRSGALKLEEFKKASGDKLNVRQLKTRGSDIVASKNRRNAIDFDFKKGGNNAGYVVDSLNKFAKLEPGAKVDREMLFNSIQIDERTLTGDIPRLSQKFSFEKEISPDALTATIDPTQFSRIKPTHEYADKTLAQEQKETKKQETQTTPATTEEEDFNLNDLMSFYGQAEVPQESGYNPDDYKREVPLTAVASGLLGAMGFAAADNEIPEFNQEIAVGLQKYIDDMLEISKQGLPPEVEAKAKNDLSDAYNLSINNIVAASGGNRNLVLGNQGQVDVGRMKAMNDIAIQDWQTKVEAMNKYGDAMKYVSDFNSQKDIMNTQMKQQIALQDRQAAGQLAGFGFTNMIQDIQAQQERAPGTPYHMLMSDYMVKSMGYDPNRQGEGPGTRAAFMQQQQEINDLNQKREEIGRTFIGFDDEKKKAYGQAWSQTSGSVDQAYRLGQVFAQNDLENLDTSQMNNALSTDDFNQLIKQNEQL